MASAFHHVFKFDNTGLSYCSVEDKTIGDQCTTAGGVSVAGGTDDDFAICPTIDSGEKNYSKVFIMPSQAKDFAFCAICSVCSCKMSIEMSPDGINWCPCVDGAQDPCTDIDCAIAASSCNCKVVSAPMMQYIRVVLHDGAAEGGKCKVTVHWTTF
tara:strand:+ start:594 stop:1061 length:468 start_codon:yes stop_codon:yes gene_type:complete